MSTVSSTPTGRFNQSPGQRPGNDGAIHPIIGGASTRAAKAGDRGVPARTYTKKRTEDVINRVYKFLVHEAQVAHDNAPTDDTAKELKKLTALSDTVHRGHISLGDLKKRFITKPRHDGHPYLTKASYRVSAATAARLDRTYQNFFRRLKAGENPGDMRYKSPARYHCLEWDHYDTSCRFNEDLHIIFCDHCDGKGVFRVTRVPCNGTGARGKKPCNKCHGAATMLNVPLGLRGQLGTQPLHDVDILSTVRQQLWETVCHKRVGSALIAYPAQNEQGFQIETHRDPTRQIVDIDGLQLVRIPLKAHRCLVDTAPGFTNKQEEAIAG